MGYTIQAIWGSCKILAGMLRLRHFDQLMFTVVRLFDRATNIHLGHYIDRIAISKAFVAFFDFLPPNRAMPPVDSEPLNYLSVRLLCLLLLQFWVVALQSTPTDFAPSANRASSERLVMYGTP